MSDRSGTIYIGNKESKQSKLPLEKEVPDFRYEVNESWVGIIPFLCILGLVTAVTFLLWVTSIGIFPQLLNFEKQVFELVAGGIVTIDVIQKINWVFTGIFFILVLFSAIWVFNYWRFQILGEWKFTKTGLEITGNYATLGSELIEYEYLKTIVTYKRQPYDLLIPGLGEIASLYMYWKYKLSIIEVRTELSYLDSKGDHRPAFTIDYIQNGDKVS